MSPTAAAPTTSPDASSPGPSPGNSPVKIGYLPITDATPLLIAHAQGFYAEEGLTAEPPTLIRSWSQLSEAFMARTVNLVPLALSNTHLHALQPEVPGQGGGLEPLNGSALTVGGKAGVESLGDLGGKQIAVPHWYSQHNVGPPEGAAHSRPRAGHPGPAAPARPPPGQPLRRRTRPTCPPPSSPRPSTATPWSSTR